MLVIHGGMLIVVAYGFPDACSLKKMDPALSADGVLTFHNIVLAASRTS